MAIATLRDPVEQPGRHRTRINKRWEPWLMLRGKLQGYPQSLLLKAVDVANKSNDPTADVRVSLLGRKVRRVSTIHFPPDRHVSWPVRPDSCSAVNNFVNAIKRKYAIVVLLNRGEISSRYLEPWSEWAMSFSVVSMANRAGNDILLLADVRRLNGARPRNNAHAEYNSGHSCEHGFQHWINLSQRGKNSSDSCTERS